MIQWMEDVKRQHQAQIEAHPEPDQQVALFNLCAMHLIAQFRGTFPPGKEPESELVMTAEKALWDALSEYDGDETRDEEKVMHAMTQMAGSVLSLARATEAKQAEAVYDEMLGDETHYPKEKANV